MAKTTLNTLFFLLLICICWTCDQNIDAQEKDDPLAWTKDAVWYQIFPERFRNGDETNDPVRQNILGSYPQQFADDWQVTPWTSDWYHNPDSLAPKQFYDFNIQARRYGGDLQGVLDQLDYLEELGITAIYFNPLNDAPSLHKYDARNYRHIDIHFGADPQGDLQKMADEKPTDPTTWVWTSADDLFLKLIKELHERDIKIIMDYSWNHTGITFWAWRDILKNGAASKYADWYEIENFDDPATPENELKYTGWAGVPTLPELKKVDVTERLHGKFYEGNIQPEVKQHIFNVTRRWMDPNSDGSFEDGVDGFRLDVADQVPMGFWREYRNYVKSINPAAYLVGENWWEKWPDHMMDPRPYLQGDVFDAVMFYQVYKPARGFFAKSVEYGGAEKLKTGWKAATSDIPIEIIQQMMVMSASHDSPRLLTSFINKNKYKYKASPGADSTYLTGAPDAETIDRVKLYLAYQFTMPGAPQIYAGDEMGMWGGDDPDCRKPLSWPDMMFDDETPDPYKKNASTSKVAFNTDLNNFYKKIIQLRKDHPVLRTGDVRFKYAKGELLVLERSSDQHKITTIFNNSNEALRIPAEIAVSGINLLNGANIEIKENDTLAPLSVLVIKME